MGNLCDCLKQDETTVSPKTPLLSNNHAPSQPGHAPSQPGHAPSPSLNPAPITVAPGQSARRFKPDDRGFETSLDLLSEISMVRIPTMTAMDKTFQDHAKLYNELYASFVGFRECLHKFKAKFAAETAGIPVMAECLRVLAKRCGGATLTGSRTKNCILIEYNAKQVSLLGQGPAEELLETLELYNQANKTIKKILEKTGHVKSSIQLILDAEAKLKREVTKADPDGKLGPGPLRMTTDNLAKLRKLPDRIDTIEKYTNKTFADICKGSKPLFQEPS